MTIVQLEYLLTVVNHGSFSLAAEHCFVSQSALSRQISLLEEELDVVLLDRGVRPIVPTEAGRAFVKAARETVSHFYEAKNKISDIKGRLTGKIRIGVIPTVSPYLIPGFVALFAARCPDVRFDIMDMHTGDMVDALNHDVIDIGIMAGGESEVRVKETELFDDRLLMYVSRENRLYGRRRIEVDDIDVRTLLILSQGNCLRNQTLKLCQRRREVHLQYDFLRCSLETLMHTADRIGGTTIIPAMAAGFIAEGRRDRIVPFASPRALRKIVMLVAPTFMRDSMTEAVRLSLIEAHDELRLAEVLAEMAEL